MLGRSGEGLPTATRRKSSAPTERRRNFRERHRTASQAARAAGPVARGPLLARPLVTITVTSRSVGDPLRVRIFTRIGVARR